MATIKEDHVGFAVAKLLKEKGFDAVCPMIYTADGELLYTDVKHHNMYAVTNKQLKYYTDIIAPSQAMAMKWLREVHGIHIVASRTTRYWSYYVQHLKKVGMPVDGAPHVDFDTYEKACEAAIKYCLENLI